MKQDDFPTLAGLLGYALMGGLLLILLLRPWWRKRRLLRAEDLDRTAAELGGEVAKDPSSEYPFVRFTIAGARAYFVRWAIGAEALAVSAVEVCLPGGTFFEATGRRSRRFPSRSPRFLELVDSDGRFRLVASDPSWARDFIERGGGDLLDRLGRDLPGPVRVQVTAVRFVVEVEASVDPATAARLAAFAEELAGLLADPATSAGIEIVAVSVDVAAARCPVCALPAEAPLLSCGVCRVPHHRDCWAYLARCAIFGCGGKTAA